jgi:hypothetical protein
MEEKNQRKKIKEKNGKKEKKTPLRGRRRPVIAHRGNKTTFPFGQL